MSIVLVSYVGFNEVLGYLIKNKITSGRVCNRFLWDFLINTKEKSTTAIDQIIAYICLLKILFLLFSWRVLVRYNLFRVIILIKILLLLWQIEYEMY
jgi:hypothetical protein